MRVLFFALLLFQVSSPCYCFAWTASEWLGVVEATAGAAALTTNVSPVSDICNNCEGTGQLGDGTISVICPVCEGTGKPKSPGTPSVSYASEEACRNCGIPGKINTSPIPPGKDAPAAKQDAVPSGGGTYNQRLFRRRR